MTYYEGSQLSIEFTGDHGCNNEKTRCNFVLQYMCSNSDADLNTRVRDGTTTTQIPLTATAAEETDPGGQPLYGMHESYSYYQTCYSRQRNQGLWYSFLNNISLIF
jgi:hypothetical protein